MFMARSIAVTCALKIHDSFGRCFSSSWFWNLAAQPTFILCLALISIWYGGDLESCFGCWGIFLGKWWGVFWFWIIWLVLILLLVHLWSREVFWGEWYHILFWGLILISFRWFWILRLRGLMTFTLFSNRFLYFHDAVISRVLEAWNEFSIQVQIYIFSRKVRVHWLLCISFQLER